VRVKLSEEGRKIHPKTSDRIGSIIDGNWPSDTLYKIKWDTEKTARSSKVHKKFLEEADDSP
jgi:hypothetical protein